MENCTSLVFGEDSGEYQVPMPCDSTNLELLNAWKAGDQSAASVLFERYQARLTALVRSRLSRRLARRVDPEDIVLSAYRSFFVASRRDQVGCGPSDDLWPLLTTFVLRKLARQSRRHTADCRSVDQEQQQGSDWVEDVASDEPTAEQAAILTDEVERLLATLDPTAREVFVRTLQGSDVGMIARELGLNERSVRRALERIRAELPANTLVLSATIHKPSRPRASSRSRITRGTVTYDQFLLRQFIGAGAFSKVYRATERASGQSVAIKFLRKACWTDERATAALISEYEILTRLKHPNILGMRGWGTSPRGALFLVTDFIPGESLAAWRKHTQPSSSQIVAIVLEVSRAIVAAHAAGVLHCDLKPANVMLRNDGRVILGDFGLARYATDPGDVPRGGTAGFLCPEQISDAFGAISVKSDVYGLGALLYALLTDVPPMTGRDLPETFANVLSARGPRSPMALGAPSTNALDAIVMRCLQKEPGLRFDSASDVMRALESLP